MSDQERAAKILTYLMEIDFSLARQYKKLTQVFPENYLQNYFSKLSSRMSQYSFELASEIENNMVNPASHEISKGVISIRKRFFQQEELPHKFLKKCIYLNKRAVKSYRNALSKINDGDSREILIRHKSILETTIKELKTLKFKLKDEKEKEELVKQIK